VKVKLGGVDFLTNSTAAALDSSLQSTLPAVTSVNGLVLFIPGIFFPSPSSLLSPPCRPVKLGLAFYISFSKTFLIPDPFVSEK